MAGVYRPRYPERTVLYRVLFHYFDQFLAQYERRFEKEYGFLRPIIKEVVERYLECGNQKCQRTQISSETPEMPEISESKVRISDVPEVSDVI